MPKFRRRRMVRWFSLFFIVVILGAYVGWALLHPLPDLKPEKAAASLNIATPKTQLNWPAGQQAAVGIVSSSILESQGSAAAKPIASTAKLIAALCVLHDKPLTSGDQGPLLTLGANDVALYNQYVAKGGSVVKVTVGEQISEYQVLQAMMLPSANNMADSLAVWAFGSLPAYTSFANSYIQQLGLKDTRIGSDASGFDPSTTSTASDLVRLGEIVMQNSVLAGIVSQPTATLPVAGIVHNINSLLGKNNIIGVKTGNTDQAGGVFVSASKINVNGHAQTIITALVGAPSLGISLTNSLPLIQSAQANFQPVTIVKAGTILGHYTLPWGGQINASAVQTLGFKAWGGSQISAKVNLSSISTKSLTGQIVGHVTVPKSTFSGAPSIAVMLTAAPTKPSPWWRLRHPFNF